MISQQKLLFKYLKAPQASTTTSSTLSNNRLMSAPTTFFPCNRRLVEGSLLMRLLTAAQAHARSVASGLSIWVSRSLDEHAQIGHQISVEVAKASIQISQ
jgi:hypothetical protein